LASVVAAFIPVPPSLSVVHWPSIHVDGPRCSKGDAARKFAKDRVSRTLVSGKSAGRLRNRWKSARRPMPVERLKAETEHRGKGSGKRSR
jgi:hypothetical protein